MRPDKAESQKKFSKITLMYYYAQKFYLEKHKLVSLKNKYNFVIKNLFIEFSKIAELDF
jgi:hypothetical protein